MYRMHQVRQSHQGRPLTRIAMQGVIKAFDPSNGDGIVVSDTDLSEYNLAPNAL